MNNEPVAWRRMEENGWYVYYETDCWDDLIPLYTHPADLTDEVLMQLYEVADYSPESYLEEARAILRKAQEK